VGMSRHVYAAVKKTCLEFVTKSRQRASIVNVDRQRVSDIRSGHTECSLCCLGARPGSAAELHRNQLAPHENQRTCRRSRLVSLSSVT